MNAQAVAQAVQECLSRCGRSDRPLVCIAQYTLKLIDDRGWTVATARQVGRLALLSVRLAARH